MKIFIKIFVITGIIIFTLLIIIGRFFTKTYLNRNPEITNLIESTFDFSSAKPFYYRVDSMLYFSNDGKINYNSTPIWNKNVEEAYISPDGKYALLYNNKHLTLINCQGRELYVIEDCTDLLHPAESENFGRLNSSSIQWSKNSDFFLIAEYGVKVSTSIYIYSISDRSFRKFIDLGEEIFNDFMLSTNSDTLFYKFVSPKGDFAFKKIDLISHKIISEHYRDDSLRLRDIDTNSVFINYNNSKEIFQCNSYDLKSIITTANPRMANYRRNSATIKDGVSIGDDGLYFRSRDTTVLLLSGNTGYGALKETSYSFFRDGFFLPGNRFFIANISATNFTGQLVIDTKTFQVMKLPKQTEFYFNVNSIDCNNFVFRYSIEPNVQFATSVRLDIEGIVRDGK